MSIRSIDGLSYFHPFGPHVPERRASARQIRTAQCGAQFTVTHRTAVVQIDARFDAVDDEPRLRGSD